MGSDATLGGRFGGADLMFRRNFGGGGVIKLDGVLTEVTYDPDQN